GASLLAATTEQRDQGRLLKVSFPANGVITNFEAVVSSNGNAIESIRSVTSGSAAVEFPAAQLVVSRVKPVSVSRSVVPVVAARDQIKVLKPAAKLVVPAPFVTGERDVTKAPILPVTASKGARLAINVDRSLEQQFAEHPVEKRLIRSVLINDDDVSLRKMIHIILQSILSKDVKFVLTAKSEEALAIAEEHAKKGIPFD